MVIGDLDRAVSGLGVDAGVIGQWLGRLGVLDAFGDAFLALALVLGVLLGDLGF